ncbi:ABC transporter ATP-binding protein [Halieaceae bacterium]|nr:ABC transporter ATP-binding protein [Halieaceae bacterium]
MLKVTDLRCKYDDHTVVDGISFSIEQGDICCLLGPSGCGKTTALRALAGFQEISGGEISLQQKVVSKPGMTMPPEQRDIGMVFQDYALFPHLSVAANVQFGLKQKELSQQKQIVDGLLELVNLGDFRDRYPHEISGGQQQRVALIRAMATGPKLLLLDEPFSNLDAELKKRLSLEVRDILKQYGISAILVTHDQDEAFAFGDKIGVLDQGILQQWDTPFNLYHQPANRFVANFIGQGCMLPGMSIDRYNIATELGTLTSDTPNEWPTDTPLEILLRPDDIVLSKDNGIDAIVEKRVFSGSATLYCFRLPTGSCVESLLPSHHNYQVGETVHIKANVEHLIAFSKISHNTKNSSQSEPLS